MRNLLFRYIFLLFTISLACSKGNFDPYYSKSINNVAIEKAIITADPSATNLKIYPVTPTEVEVTYNSKRSELVAGLENTGFLLYIGESLNENKLPTSIIDYLGVTYPTYVLERASEKKNRIGETIGFTTSILSGSRNYHNHFFANGVLDRSSDLSGTIKPRSESISKPELPISITDYLNGYFPNYILVNAQKETLNAIVKGYSLKILSAENKQLQLFFDASGEFLKSREGELGFDKDNNNNKEKLEKMGRGKDHGKTKTIFNLAQLPNSITNYLANNYTTHELKKAYIFTTEGVTTGYLIEIKFGGKNFALQFDKDAKFQKEVK
jgi:hypothetical protein